MKLSVHLRPFLPGDYHQVINLWRLSGLVIKPSDSLSELQKLTAFNSNCFLVAEATTANGESEVVGAVIGAFDGRRAWIYHLAVLPNARRSGLGKRLIREVEQHLRAQGATKVNLLVEPGNQTAAHFYKSIGYSEVPLVFFTRVL